MCSFMAFSFESVICAQFSFLLKRKFRGCAPALGRIWKSDEKSGPKNTGKRENKSLCIHTRLQDSTATWASPHGTTCKSPRSPVSRGESVSTLRSQPTSQRSLCAVLRRVTAFPRCTPVHVEWQWDSQLMPHRLPHSRGC